jgi:hypothetical protein
MITTRHEAGMVVYRYHNDGQRPCKRSGQPLPSQGTFRLADYIDPADTPVGPLASLSERQLGLPASYRGWDGGEHLIND